MKIFKIALFIITAFNIQTVQAKDELELPRCGYFGPSQEFNNNIGVYWTFLFSSPSYLFDFPYLAGCNIAGLHYQENNSPYLNQYHILYNTLGYAKAGHRLLRDKKSKNLRNSFYHIEYLQNQLVQKVSHLCSSGNGEEIYNFFYDGEDRLIRYYHRRPENCFEPSTSLHLTKSFDYKINELKNMPSGGTIKYRYPKPSEVNFTVEYDYDSLNRILSKRELQSDGILTNQSVIYDKVGRVIEKTIHQTKLQRTLEKKIYKYQYDSLGRLIQIKQPNEAKSWIFDYQLNGQIKDLVIPTPNFNQINDPQYHLKFNIIQ